MNSSKVSDVDRILLIVLAVSLLANVGLVFSARRAARRAAVYATNQADLSRLPPVGARLDELNLTGVDEKKLDLNLDPHGLPIVVYVLSPTCRWCKLNQINVDSLTRQMQGKYRVIGVSTTSSGLDSYVAANAPAFPVYSIDASSMPSKLRFSGTPETLVFSPDGFFLRGWTGAYIKSTKEQVSTFFGVKLPDWRSLPMPNDKTSYRPPSRNHR